MKDSAQRAITIALVSLTVLLGASAGAMSETKTSESSAKSSSSEWEPFYAALRDLARRGELPQALQGDPSRRPGPATLATDPAAESTCKIPPAKTSSCPATPPPACKECNQGVCVGCAKDWVINCYTYTFPGIGDDPGGDGGEGLAVTKSCKLCTCYYSTTF